MSQIKMDDKMNAYPTQKVDFCGQNILAFHAETSDLQNGSNQDVCYMKGET